MDKKETIKNIINNNNGIAKTADFVAEGLTNYDVANLYKEGYLERIRHGYYQLAEQEDIKEEQVLASLLPESIICVESALFYYGYSDFSPGNGQLPSPVPSHGQGCISVLWRQRYILYSLPCLKLEK